MPEQYIVCWIGEHHASTPEKPLTDIYQTGETMDYSSALSKIDRMKLTDPKLSAWVEPVEEKESHVNI